MFRVSVTVIAAGALVALGFSIGHAAGERSGTRVAAATHHQATVMGFYSPPMCTQDGGKAEGPVAYCTLQDGYVIKFGDFNENDCATDRGRVIKTAWGRYCGLPSGYAVKIDMNTSHAIESSGAPPGVVLKNGG